MRGFEVRCCGVRIGWDRAGPGVRFFVGRRHLEVGRWNGHEQDGLFASFPQYQTIPNSTRSPFTANIHIRTYTLGQVFCFPPCSGNCTRRRHAIMCNCLRWTSWQEGRRRGKRGGGEGFSRPSVHFVRLGFKPVSSLTMGQYTASVVASNMRSARSF